MVCEIILPVCSIMLQMSKPVLHLLVSTYRVTGPTANVCPRALWWVNLAMTDKIYCS